MLFVKEHTMYILLHLFDLQNFLFYYALGLAEYIYMMIRFKKLKQHNF